jgi:hypothetical protein
MASARNTIRLGLFLGCLVIAVSIFRLGAVPYVTREKRWSIGIYTGPSPFKLHAPRTVLNPVLSARDVSDVPAKFVADPFMIKKDSTWYMFFEVLNANSRRGEIGFATSSDALHWSYGRIVLAEPFHLSYPYVFTFENQYYMIPESGEARSVRLYKSEEFPTKWAFAGTLLAGSAFVDSSVVRYQDKWFLFTDARPYVNDTLGLYYADTLAGPWHEHPKSPIVANAPHTSRPAGRVLTANGKLFRYAQDDSPSYGTQVFAFEITDLTTTTYQERPVSESPILGRGGDGWNAKGMHHVDAHQVDENAWIACVDGAQGDWALRFYNWQ